VVKDDGSRRRSYKPQIVATMPSRDHIFQMMKMIHDVSACIYGVRAPMCDLAPRIYDWYDPDWEESPHRACIAIPASTHPV